FIWSKELGGRFLLIASLLYLAALGANSIYVLNNQCGFAFLPGRPEMFAGVILALLIFEWFAHRAYGGNMTRQTGLWLLGGRLVLIEIATMLDCSFFASILYLLIPFLAYIFSGKWTASILAVALTIWIAIKVGFFRCHGCQLDEYVTPVLQFGVGLLWSTVMGGLVKGVETSRARTKQLLTDLEQSHHQLRDYAAQVEELATAEERNRVARDIHDSVGHSLAVVNVQLEKALVFLRRDVDVTEQAMKDARRAAKEALGDVRESVRTLRQSADVFSLMESLTALIEHSRNDMLDINLKMGGSESGYSKPALMTFYRAAQEALTNVHKHANASQVQMTIHLGDVSGRLQVQDNGIGFDAKQMEELSTQRQGHYGLQGIQERLELVGGEMSIESESGLGTTLTVTIPKGRLSRPHGEKSDDE
ncbi:MAG TPA: sensor histidine kinase, partial [Anaerolineales bacterium]|nr:sensor histidine kinase [Anaerolineales bacterium]